MSKYIDAEWIRDVYADYEHYENRDDWTTPIANVLAVIDDAPSIDICFCRECKHNYNKVLNHGKMKPRCDFTDRVLTENDFCSRGEREGE